MGFLRTDHADGTSTTATKSSRYAQARKIQLGVAPFGGCRILYEHQRILLPRVFTPSTFPKRGSDVSVPLRRMSDVPFVTRREHGDSCRLIPHRQQAVEQQLDRWKMPRLQAHGPLQLLSSL
jgi:hypothetical protein